MDRPSFTPNSAFTYNTNPNRSDLKNVPVGPSCDMVAHASGYMGTRKQNMPTEHSFRGTNFDYLQSMNISDIRNNYHFGYN